ncbi:metal ABC transporter solute-binding protein, Zn/Mn family [Spirochaeta dissipatitropha]
MKKLFIYTAVSAVILSCSAMNLSAAGRQEGNTDSSYPIKIVATTGMIGDLVSAVGAEHVIVEVLMGEEVDPHLYRPTRADIARMQNADLIFYNGLNLEGRMGDTLVQLARNKPVHAVSELIEESYLLDDEEYENAYDPHLWMDVSLWIRALEVVESVLKDYDPAHSEDFSRNTTAYREQLQKLDSYIREISATIPMENRVLLTAHDAFGYFGAAYNIEVFGVQGMSTESEAGLDDINQLVRMVSDRKIKAVFAESTVPDRALQAVIEGAQARGHNLVLGGELFSDAMGPAGSYEGTYIGMMDHNASTIVRALGGQAPDRGWKNRLSPR